MLSTGISLAGAVTAGIVSFLSPCVLPLVPAYLSFLAGASLEDLRNEAQRELRRRLLVTAACFVAGFSLVFILLGASATSLGKWLAAYTKIFERLAGALLVILGLHVVGIIRIPFLMMEKRLHPAQAGLGLVRALFVGAAFAFGWTPCVGPILAGILALAGTRETVMQGIWLLAAYSAGLGIPFLAAALGVNQFLRWLQGFKRYFRWVEVASGLLLIGIGAAIAFGSMARMSAWFSPLGALAL